MEAATRLTVLTGPWSRPGSTLLVLQSSSDRASSAVTARYLCDPTCYPMRFARGSEKLLP